MIQVRKAVEADQLGRRSHFKPVMNARDSRQPAAGLTRKAVRNEASNSNSRVLSLYSGVVNVQIRKRLTLSSTAASFAVFLLILSTASPNDPPGLGSRDISLTKCPSIVNSTSSLGCAGSGLIESLLVTNKWPFGDIANPSAPCKCFWSS